MKRIKHMIWTVSVISLIMGGLISSFGQEGELFFETYNRGEIISLLESGDELFNLISPDREESESAVIGIFPESGTEQLWKYLQGRSFREQLPADLRFAWGNDDPGMRCLYALREAQGRPAPGKRDIQSVNLQEGSSKDTYDLLVSFNSEGGEKWASMTRENLGRNIAIVIGDEVISAPRVMSEIRQGKCLISGNLNKDEATRIQLMLKE